MTSRHLNLWKAKLKAARVEERQWAKAYNRAERGMCRIGKQITELEIKIANELAKLEQRTGASD